MKEPTVRIQKIKKDTIKTRLIIFGALALILLLCSVFCEHLTPYDPYLQDLKNAKAPPSLEHLFGTDRYGRDMLSRVIVGSKTSIFSTLLLVGIVTVLGTMVGVFCGWHGKWIDTVLMRISDMFLRPGRRPAERDHRAGSDLLAQIRTHRTQPDPGPEGDTLSESGEALRQRPLEDHLQTYPAEHHRPDPCHLHAGHWYHDDGTRRTLLPRSRRQAAYSGVGQHDERRAKPPVFRALGHPGPRLCHLYFRDDL